MSICLFFANKVTKRYYLFFLNTLYKGIKTNAPEMIIETITGPSICLTDVSTI